MIWWIGKDKKEYMQCELKILFYEDIEKEQKEKGSSKYDCSYMSFLGWCNEKGYERLN